MRTASGEARRVRTAQCDARSSLHQRCCLFVLLGKRTDSFFPARVLFEKGHPSACTHAPRTSAAPRAGGSPRARPGTSLPAFAEKGRRARPPAHARAGRGTVRILLRAPRGKAGAHASRRRARARTPHARSGSARAPAPARDKRRPAGAGRGHPRRVERRASGACSLRRGAPRLGCVQRNMTREAAPTLLSSRSLVFVLLAKTESFCREFER